MPVGTSFENSSMKASFSLSSLQATETTPDKLIKTRQFNSLTKKRIKATPTRKSWGSTASENGDEFWSALQANYNYIMDNQLIDKCQEANSDLNLESETWTLEELKSRYSELYLWLNSVQEMIYGKEENITDKALRLTCQSMVLEKSPSINLFNDYASQLVEVHPELQDEVAWRVNLLNSKWDTISSILGPASGDATEQDTWKDIDHEIKCLRKWFKNMEQILEPLNLRTKYTKTEIEAKALELKVLHRDIENHGKIVGSVVKLCKLSDASCTTANVRRIANGLERRWHLLFLRLIEWQCHLESLSKRDNIRNQHQSSDESDSDYYQEPANKYPRLSLKHDQQEMLSCDSVKSAYVMNGETANKPNGESVDTVDGIFVSGEDTAQFNRSNRKAPNLATYYFKHIDTDSDMDKVEQQSVQSKNEVQSTHDETSEEEWTYTKNEEEYIKDEIEDLVDEMNDTLRPKPVPEITIKRLVQKAEELVHPEKRDRIVPLNKMSRVKQWLRMEKPDDSCDASGEDDEKESQLSEDLDESSTTFKVTQGCNSHNTSFIELYSELTPKVQMRQRKHNGNRPWSVSCISQLNSPQSNMAGDFASFSISESALHNMTLTPKKFNDFNSTSHIGVNGNNSTSSTMEESCNILAEEKSSPTRRRKFKMRRKYSHKPNFKSEQRCASNRLFKSSSYSGNSNVITTTERQTSSDPPAVSIFGPGKYETTTTSGAETDDSVSRRMPVFKIGAKTEYLTIDKRDSSPGKSSLNTTEEQSSSMSEQAWDSYQEKYLSEAYSEAHDSDAARRLLEFGEDYRNFIDSQSDWSTNPDFSPTYRRRTLNLNNSNGVDSESDTESLRNIINSSGEQLRYAQNIHRQQINLGLGQYLESNDIGELISTCDRHIDLLSQIQRSSEDCAISREDKKAATVLLQQWQEFKKNVLKMHQYRNLQKDILQLKHSLNSVKIPQADSLIDLGYVDDLEKEVARCEKILAEIQDYKKKLFELNVAVHHLVVENKEYNASSLKNDISQLYCLWEDLHTKITDRLLQLRPLLETWRTLENRLDQLHGDLRSDEKTLCLLDTALKGGTLSEQTATYVRDVAKLLSETNTTQGCTIPELFTEGSLSDSGISDEGSEHELGERERRLAAIRRLVRQLEVVLSPDSDARVRMTDRLNAAAEELKTLQNKCRSLIVRSAACSIPAGFRDEETKAKTKDGGGDPEDDNGANSWFKRAVKASVPFQLVIVTILCIAWLLEPQCCDNMNNYAWSLSPQLRYVNGPPPI